MGGGGIFPTYIQPLRGPFLLWDIFPAIFEIQVMAFTMSGSPHN